MTPRRFEFQWLWFVISFSFGILYVYLVHPTMPVVIKYPTPINAGKVVYKDTSNKCYTYAAKHVSCPMHPIEQNIVPV